MDHLTLLAKLEEKLAEKHAEPSYSIAKHFDLIGGTSVGGILALGFAHGFNARRLLTIIDENRKTIFKKPPLSNIPIVGEAIKTAKRACFSLHSTKPLKSVLENEFGTATIGDLKIPIVIPAVNATTGLPKFYKTPHHPDFTFDKKVSLVDAALATSAAPTFFNPYLVNDESLMVDGGLVANSPSLIANHEGIKFLGWAPDDIHILSIGTMGTQTTFPIRKRWGYVRGWGWGEKLVELTLGANEAMHHFMVKQLLGDRFVEIDDPNTRDTANIITLNNADDRAAQSLKGRGTNRAQYVFPRVSEFFDHIPDSVTFYDDHGDPYEV